MLSANKEKLQSFFQGSNQFIIPFFQRSYVWKIDNWSELWENIVEVINESETNSNSEHFIGTIIVQQAQTEKLGSLIYNLIDGQQRLTTICLLLKALHDASKDEALRNWILSLLIYIDSYGEKNLRIIHSKVDKEHFQKILLANDNNDSLYIPFITKFQTLNRKERDIYLDSMNKIDGAYLFFRVNIKEQLHPDQIRTFVTILLEKLPVIHMALTKEDDVQHIFDTINSLGVRLTAAELLKNHLYSYPAVSSKYKEYWENVFEADEDSTEYWNKNRTSGRIIRTTIELFLYSYLIIKNENLIKIDTLFKEFKTYLKDKENDSAALLEFAKELSEYGKLYATIPNGENLAEINFKEQDKRFLHVVQELDNTTVFPLVLYIYKNVKNIDERNKILNLLESYLVRRTACHLTTKNYNNLFIGLIKDLKKEGIVTYEYIRTKLLSYNDDTNRFPTDEEFINAFHSTYLINQYSREILFCIALYQMDNEMQDNTKLSNYGFSLEHIMPKKWKNNWSLSRGYNEDYRNQKLLTLGNLTLVKGKLNSSMRDSNWKRKKEALRQYSTLRITTDYIYCSTWDEKIIEKRANDLSVIALKIWQR